MSTCTRTARRLIAAAAAPLLVLGLASCAPEPMAGEHRKGEAPAEDGGTSWSQSDEQDDPELKHAELPEGFPSDEFQLPEGALIDDAGKRRDRVWFVVLRAADAAEADRWWSELIERNGFAVRDEEETGDGGRSATIASERLTAAALTIPEADGSVLMSYDITQEL